MDRKKILEQTGEKGMKKAPEMKLDQLRLNGSKGEFYLVKLTSEKGPDGKYPKVSLGTAPIEIVMLKHRRALFQFVKNGKSFMTNEHNHKDDRVMLFGPNEKGTASDLREKYQGLRTHQIVYCYVPVIKKVYPEHSGMVRFQIKGSSLGSQNEVKGVVKYYEYLGSFDKDESSAEYKTVVRLVPEQGPQGEYFAMAFERGERLTDEQFEKVAAMITEVADHCNALDEYYQAKAPQEIVKEAAPDEVATVEYPDDEINPEDIPF